MDLKRIEKTAQPFVARVLQAIEQFRALRGCGPAVRPWWVEVAAVGDIRMRQANLQHRGKDRTTDVLSFPAPEPFRSQGHLGELVLCGPQLKRQAQQLKHSELQELRVLVVHGVLHLLGFDHERGEQESREMAWWEQKVMAAVEKTSRQPVLGLIDRSQHGKTKVWKKKSRSSLSTKSASKSRK